VKIRSIRGKNIKHSAPVECFFCGRYPRVGLSVASPHPKMQFSKGTKELPLVAFSA
jgi:hypothetical protein